MNQSFEDATTPSEGGFFMPASAADLNRCFEQTVEDLDITPAEMIQAGWGTDEIAMAIASMPPFRDVLAERVRRRWFDNN
jgi:hypothetical protein